MTPVRRAVIDVGTNSVKLLVAEVAEREVRPLWEGSHQTRLGRGLYETHRLQPEPMAQTAAAVADFAARAREWRADTVRIIATSAAREAVNAVELISAIESATGIPLEILSGDQEAQWAFAGVATDPDLATRPLLLLDVGGGSTEFILGQGQQKHFSTSIPVGTVRLMEKIPHSDPPKSMELSACREWLKSFLATEVHPRLQPALEREVGLHASTGGVQFVGTGGTTSILARMEADLEIYDRQRIEATRLSLDRMRWHLRRLWGLPLIQRQQIRGLPPKRADVILTGVAIYEAVMDQFGFAELRVSTRGLRFAAVLDEADPADRNRKSS